ncbi:hypothetical protein B0T17DRAFT_646893 [Bombardia bombarda]|uniref:Uncharacterized protein n=1 Tax=Bombardia bombarda TaxID=252184 RepID=A0AA39WGY6_9PEZI|nr:hypothetical protein B0T17DRAFT_646893 [Bombardia bombarda]
MDSHILTKTPSDLALSITKNINSSEFTVLIILIILFVAIFFCHGLIRLCMMIVRGKNGDSSSSRTQQLPQMYGPGGYAIPREPIRVVMARDEEAAGIESETTKISPPAYGLWRESVRVDPNRIYWQRNHQNPTAEDDAMDEDGLPSSASNTSRSDISSSGRTTAPRPPSYVSEDGVSYIVEAQGRSIAPTTDVPLGTAMNAHHPAEAGRAGPPPAW